jgi:hypothetical protein
VGGFDEELPNYADADFNRRASLAGHLPLERPLPSLHVEGDD